MDKREREEEGGVKVSDRRRFDASGEARPGEGERKPEPEGESGPGGQPHEEERGLPKMDFSSFMLSLAASAQVHMGALPDPQSGKEKRDLSMARQTIDLIGLLEQKTKGNLSAEESSLVEHLLYDLRMMYVEASGKGE